MEEFLCLFNYVNFFFVFKEFYKLKSVAAGPYNHLMCRLVLSFDVLIKAWSPEVVR